MKKKLSIIFLMIFLVSVFVFFKPEKVDALKGTCTEIQTYYFLEAESANAYKESPDGEGYETSFIPNIAGSNYKITNISTNVSGEEFKKYIEAEKARQDYYKDSDLTPDEIERTSFCNNGVCLNSRVDENAYTLIGEETIKSEGGYDEFIKNYMVTNYDLGDNKVKIATNEDGTTKYNADGTVGVIVDRDWELTQKQQNGGYDHDDNSATPGILFFPVVVEVEVTYTCELPDPPVPVSCSSINSNSFGAGCGGGSGSSEYTRSYAYTYDTGTVSDEDELALCSTSGSSGRDNAKAYPLFTQSGSLNFNYTKETYAGGGVSIRASYSNQASWNYCVDQSHTEPIMCIHEEYLPYCTGGYSLNVDEGICEKEETDTENVNADGTCPSGYDLNWSGTKCKKTTIKTKDYDCGWQSVSVDTDSGCYDVSPAETEFAKRAASEYQSGESGDIEAPDSNVVGGGSVLLNGDGDDSPGSLSGPSGSVGGSWQPGSVVSTTMRFSLNNACINVFTAKVTYRQSGCTADEIDGYSLYYVPLKMKDKSSFTIDVSGFQLSSLTQYRNWNWDASCSVKIQQRLYGDNKFVYRPVDLRPADADAKAISVFPKSNGDPSENWEWFWENTNVVENKMTRNDLEYHGILSQNTVNSIKKYNGYGYNDFASLSRSGKSSVLGALGISWQNDINSVEYNDLGKCEENCW